MTYKNWDLTPEFNEQVAPKIKELMGICRKLNLPIIVATQYARHEDHHKVEHSIVAAINIKTNIHPVSDEMVFTLIPWAPPETMPDVDELLIVASSVIGHRFEQSDHHQEIREDLK